MSADNYLLVNRKTFEVKLYFGKGEGGSLVGIGKNLKEAIEIANQYQKENVVEYIAFLDPPMNKPQPKTDEQVLKAAIEKAEKNGWKNKYRWGSESFFYLINDGTYPKIIFDLEFAKAFWGEEFVCRECLRLESEKGEARMGDHLFKSCKNEIKDFRWLYYIAELAKSENRIGYLRKFLDE